GKIHLTTDYPDALPVFTFAKSDSLRRRMSIAFNTRAYPKNQEVLTSLMNTRYEIATLLGYSSWADFNAADKMIAKGHNIADFIQQVDDASRALARKEFAMLLAEKQKTDPNAKEIWSHEGGYLSELVRRTKYDFDSQSVRPYFPFMEVKQGILDTAADLFHVTFQQEQDVPAWDPAVETWIVIDSGKPIGRFYLDMHPRPGKYSHAEMAPVLDGIRFRRSPFANARRMDSQPASSCQVCPPLQNRRTHPGRSGGAHEPRLRLRTRWLGGPPKFLQRHLLRHLQNQACRRKPRRGHPRRCPPLHPVHSPTRYSHLGFVWSSRRLLFRLLHLSLGQSDRRRFLPAIRSS